MLRLMDGVACRENESQFLSNEVLLGRLLSTGTRLPSGGGAVCSVIKPKSLPRIPLGISLQLYLTQVKAPRGIFIQYVVQQGKEHYQGQVLQERSLKCSIRGIKYCDLILPVGDLRISTRKPTEIHLQVPPTVFTNGKNKLSLHSFSTFRQSASHPKAAVLNFDVCLNGSPRSSLRYVLPFKYILCLY